MADTKTFSTQFRIGATWTGQAGIAKAQTALTRLGKHAQATAARMRTTMAATAAGVFGGAAVFAAATRAIHAVADAHEKAVAAAEEAQKVEDHLGLTLEKNAKRWGLNEKQVKLQQKAIIGMGDSLETLGLDGETAVAMFDELTRSVDPRNLANYKKGLADFLIEQKGVNASQEDAVSLGQDIAKVIEFKMPKALKKFKGVTEEQIAAYSKLETREERQAWFMKNIAKETGALEKAMDTAEGKLIKRANMFEALQEAWGKPWLVLRQDIGEALGSIVEQIKPHMDRLSEEMGPRLKAIGEEFKAWAKSEEVVKWFDRLGAAVKFVTDHWKELSIAVAAVAGFAAVGVVLGTVAIALSALLSPIGLVVIACAALVAAGVAIYANWDTIAAKAKEVWGVIQAAWENGVAAIKNYDIIGAFNAWLSVPQWVWDNVLAPTIQFFWNLVEPIRNAVAGVYDAITAPFLKAYNAITGWFSKLPGKIWNAAQQAQLPEPSTSADTSGGMQSEFQKFEQRQKSGGLPTTEYSQGSSAGGPDEMQDKWTNRGYSSTGQNLTPGVVAVNEKAHRLGTIFQDRKTGKHYLAADRHGNRRAGVVDVYKSPGTYGKTGRPDLVAVGKIPRGDIPKSAAGMQRYLQSLDAGQKGSSLRDTTRSLRPSGGAGTTNITGGTTNVNITGVAPGRESLMAKKTALALRDPTAQLLAQIKQARDQEQRLGYV